MFTIGNTLNCSYGGQREENQWLTSHQSNEDEAYGCFTRFPFWRHRLGLLYIMILIPICGGQTGNVLRLQPFYPTQCWSRWRPWGAQIQSGGSRKSTYLEMPRDLVLGRLSHLNLLGDLQVQGPRRSTCLDVPRDPVLGRPTCLNLPRDLISKRLSCLSLPGDSISKRLSCLSLPGDHTLTWGCSALMSQQCWYDKLQKDSPLRKSTHGNRRKPISCGTVPGLSNNSGAQQEPHYHSGKSKRGPPRVYQSGLRFLQGTGDFKGQIPVPMCIRHQDKVTTAPAAGPWCLYSWEGSDSHQYLL